MSSLAVGTPDSRSGVSTNWVTLVDLLEWRAQSQAERVAYTFLGEGESERISLSWAELHGKAHLIGQRVVGSARVYHRASVGRGCRRRA